MAAPIEEGTVSPARLTSQVSDLDKAEDAITAIWAVAVALPALPFVIGYFFVLTVVQGLIKIGRLLTTGRIHPKSKPTPRLDPQASPRYRAHGPDGGIIGEYDTIEECEIAGLLACGVKTVDLPLALHERRRLGTYGGMYGEERKSQPQSQPWRYPIEYQCATCGLRSPSGGTCGRCNESNAFPIYPAA
ncbi:MAG TPA: hypothetical protein VG147_06560 [Solirubrobacteraceae bacterium]|jgi:hypothetical protein|nr:hypothetical protein [Solirubrobacteraceae bacterium]